MENVIYPCLWFDGNARAAADFYCSVFRNSVITADTPTVVTFAIDGVKFMGLNGGPQFKPTPAISFYVTFDDEGEVRRVWEALADGGLIFMPLDRYDWSARYGWVQDRFGLSWQLSLGDRHEVGQGVVPLLMFCGDQQGRAQEAMQYYTSLFGRSKVERVATYEPGQVDLDATVVHARFRLLDQCFMVMDSAVPQPFSFTEGISLVVDCETQEEIDGYWTELVDGGEESRCGWLKDRFGVSWQIVPTILPHLLADLERAERVMEAFMQMKKFDIERLVNA